MIAFKNDLYKNDNALSLSQYIYIYIYIIIQLDEGQSAGAVESNDCISALE